MRDSVHIAELVMSLDNDRGDKKIGRTRDRRLGTKLPTQVPDQEVEEVVNEASRIFREKLQVNSAN
jgi:hypothetical protein